MKIKFSKKHKIFFIIFLINIYILAGLFYNSKNNSNKRIIEAEQKIFFADEDIISTENGDFVDFIRPEFTYDYSKTTIDHGTKIVEIVFDATDKFFDINSADLSVNDLTILVDGEEPDWTKVTKTLTYSDSTKIYNDVHTTVATNGVFSNPVVNRVIGRRYTLTLTGLDQGKVEDDSNYDAYDKYADYSGVVTIAIPANKITDLNGLKNLAKTMTVSVDTPDINDGEDTSSAENVDVTSPIWEKTTESFSEFPVDGTNSAQITINGSDKFWNDTQRELVASDITVFVNGTEVQDLTASGLTLEIGYTNNSGVFVPGNGGKALTETITRNSGKDYEETRTNTTYGKEYTIKISGFADNTNKIKITVHADVLIDKYGNKNIATDFTLLNNLRIAGTAGNYETQNTSAFLGSDTSKVQRQDVTKVIFTNNLDGLSSAKYSWDVSAQGDGSIKAWVNTTSGPYTVYIGSEDTITANKDSSYLFSYIGSGDSCNTTSTIENIEYLNTLNVTNMQYMFQSFGSKAMTSLNLENNFDTKNVTNMEGMFKNCGYTAMTNLTLPNKFTTPNVTNYKKMFKNCGHTAMTTLNLSNASFNTSGLQNVNMEEMFAYCGYEKLGSLDLSTFNTSKVTDMNKMFDHCGYGSMSTLNLGSNFDTSKVTDMDNMFEACGYTKLATFSLQGNFDTSSVTTMAGMFKDFGHEKLGSFDLGEKFNTKSVTNMSSMFEGCGNKLMTTMNLRENFYTSSVTTMANMFKNCGTTSMESLYLGPAFTIIPTTHTDMFTECGKVGSGVIYAPESICIDEDSTHFKLNTNETNPSITLTNRTINMYNKMEWVVTATSVDTENKSIIVTLQGKGVNTTYAYDILNINDISLKINGEDANCTSTLTTGSILKALSAPTSIENGVEYTLTLSNFEQAVRQTGKEFLEWSGNIEITVANKTIFDIYSIPKFVDKTTTSHSGMQKVGNANVKTSSTISKANVTQNTTNALFTDFIKPAITYRYSDTTINYGTKTLTVVFDMTDKYYKVGQTPLTLADLQIFIDGYGLYTVDTNKDSLEHQDIYGTQNASGVILGYGTTNTTGTTKIGKRYTLVIGSLPQNDDTKPYDPYSGTVSIAISANKVEDYSGNKNMPKTITVGVDEPGSQEDVDDENPHDDSVIVDVVDPEWRASNINVDYSNKKIDLTLTGTDKYLNTSYHNLSAEDDITVFIDGVQVDDYITKTLIPVSTGTANPAITETRTENTVVNRTPVSTTTPNYQYAVQYNLTISGLEQARVLTEHYQNYSGEVEIVIAADTLKDQSNNTNKARVFDLGHADFTKPEVEKVSSRNLTDPTDGKVKQEIKFNVVDRFYDTTQNYLTAEDLNVFVDGEDVIDNDLTRVLTHQDLTESRTVISKLHNDQSTTTTEVYGVQYTLVLSDFEKRRTTAGVGTREYADWSGQVRIEVPANKVRDTATSTNYPNVVNRNDTDTYGNSYKANITYTGIDNNKNLYYTMNGEFIDVVKPTFTYQYSNTIIDHTTKEVTIVFDATDKFFDTIHDNETLLNELIILVDGEVPTGFNKSISSQEINQTVAVTTSEGVETTESRLIGYRYTLTLTGLDIGKVKTGDHYADWSGVVTIAIPAGVIKDVAQTTIEESLAPARENIAKTVTVGVDIPLNNLPSEYQEVEYIKSNDRNCCINTNIIPTLNFEYNFVFENGENYSSNQYIFGTSASTTAPRMNIRLNTNGGYSMYFNSSSGSATSIYSSTSLVINQKHNITLSGDYNSQKYHLVIDKTVDKMGTYNPNVSYNTPIRFFNYSSNTNASAANLKVYYFSLKNDGVLVRKMIPCYRKSDNVVGMYDLVEGKFYTNAGTGTFGMGPDVNDGNDVYTKDAVNVDVTSPVWRKVTEASSEFPVEGTNVAQITINGTDKFWRQDNAEHPENNQRELLTRDITLYVDGQEVSDLASAGLTLQIGKTESGAFTEGNGKALTENITRNAGKDYKEERTNFVYGKEYTIKISGFADTTNKIKIVIAPDVLEDQYTNKSIETEFTLLNNLRVAGTTGNYETEATSAFLGSDTSKFQRKDITKVVFTHDMADLESSIYSWDVSSLHDGSIMAWVDTSTGPYTVYIGSEDTINANSDSSYLFSYIGSGSNCNTTTTVEGLAELNTANVLNMQYMFQSFGSNAMTSLDLGSNFDTKNVTNMEGIFKDCGYNAMTTFDLGDKIDTLAVTNMKNMFQNFGHDSLLELDLSTLNEDETESKFKTINVTNMDSMFEGCGYGSMTNINLGLDFNTSSVATMDSMFKDCGYNLLTELKLNSKFTTILVTDMDYMFNNCGHENLTNLDLGGKFTRIADDHTDFMEGACKADTTVGVYEVYVAESIYDTIHSLKLAADSDTIIEYPRANIYSKYKMGWQLHSTDLDTENKKINIEIDGVAFNAEYASSNIAVSDLKVFINDEFEENGILLTDELTEENSKTHVLVEISEPDLVSVDNGVRYTITLSNFEQFARQSLKEFKEWSGNIKLIVDSNTIYDTNGNTNLVTTLENGAYINSYLDNTLFADFIDPEITYRYSNTTMVTEDSDYIIKINDSDDLNYVAELTVGFDFTDKYYNPAQDAIELSDLTFVMDGYGEIDINVEGNTLTSELIYGTVNENGAIIGKIPEDGDTNTIVIGRRYTLKVKNLPQTYNEETGYYDYSGFASIIFNTGLVEDYSENVNIQKTITIGVDDPGSEIDQEDEDPSGSGVHTDTVKPTWQKVDSEIFRTRDNFPEDKVTLTVVGTDKYLDVDNCELTVDDITVYLNADTDGITNGTDITDQIDISVGDGSVQTQTLSENVIINSVNQVVTDSEHQYGVQYVITLKRFKKLNGKVTVVIDKDTLVDKTGNKSMKKAFEVGNAEWVEAGDTESDGNVTYNAFRNRVVDFVRPKINYKYSYVYDGNSNNNPNINITNKTVTIGFDITDDHLLVSNLSQQNLKDNLKIFLDGLQAYGNGVEDSKSLTANLAVNHINNTNIYRYTLTLTGFDQGDAYDYSGPMTFVFAPNIAYDTSKNTNARTTITIDKRDSEPETLPSQINETNYGDSVEYSTVINDVTLDDWKILYNDGEKVSIIYGGYLPNSTNLAENAGLVQLDSYGVSSSTSREDLINILNDTSEWNSLLNEELISKGATAIGTADLSVLIASWNAKGYTTLNSQYVTEGYNAEGYLLGTTYSQNVSDNIGFSDTLYYPTSPNNYNGYWLGNESANSSNSVMSINSEGSINNANYSSSNYAIRPVITLPASVLGEKEDGVWKLTLEENIIVDVVSPVWNYISSDIYYDSTNVDNPQSTEPQNRVEMVFQGTDKYLRHEGEENTLNTSVITNENVKNYISVYIDNANVTSSVNMQLIVEDSTSSSQYIKYKLVVSNFGDYSGVGKIVIKENTLTDYYGNKNLETTLYFGTGETSPNSSEITRNETQLEHVPNSFRQNGIIDFVKPVWSYVTSSIDRARYNDGTDTSHSDKVTIRLSVYDKYFDRDYFYECVNNLNNLTMSDAVDEINVFVNNNDLSSEIVKELAYIADVSTTDTHVFDLTLSNFGYYTGVTEIVINSDVIIDTSGNGNSTTEKINVGNTNWDGDGSYNAFRSGIVDFVFPAIVYQYSGDQGKTKVEGTEEYTGEIGENVPNNYIDSGDVTTDLNPIIIRNTSVNEGSITIDFSIKDAIENGTVPYMLENQLANDNIVIKMDDEDISEFINKSLTVYERDYGYDYTLVLTDLETEENNKDNVAISQYFVDYSGVLKICVPSEIMYDSSGNTSEIEFVVDYNDGDGDIIDGEMTTAMDIDITRPHVFIYESSIDFDNSIATITFRSTDKFYNLDSVLNPDELEIHSEDAAENIRNICNVTSTTEKMEDNDYGYEYVITLNNYNLEREIYVEIPEDTIIDKYGNKNKAITLTLVIDNQKPLWKYININVNKNNPVVSLDELGNVIIKIEAQDMYLLDDSSKLNLSDIMFLKDGVDITHQEGITLSLSEPVSSTKDINGSVRKLRCMTYELTVTGLTSNSEYSVVIAPYVLKDGGKNYSNGVTLTFSRSIFRSTNFKNVWYFVGDNEYSWVNELYNVNATGTNTSSSVYSPTSMGELIAERAKDKDFLDELVNRVDFESDNNMFKELYNESTNFSKGFKGWVKANRNGNYLDNNGEIIRLNDAGEITAILASDGATVLEYYDDNGNIVNSNGKIANENGKFQNDDLTYTNSKLFNSTYTIYTLEDEVPSSVDNLRAVFKDVKVVFVSNSAGDDSNTGKRSSPVQTLTGAYSKLSIGKLADEQYIVIMDTINISSDLTTETGKNATITSLFAGIDYANKNSAKLSISADLSLGGDTIFDNINITDNGNHRLICNYHDIILGRKVLTDNNKNTFSEIIGGNYGPESTVGNVGIHRLVVTRGSYNNIYIGSYLNNNTGALKFVTHNVQIGSKKDASRGQNDRLTIDGCVYLGNNEKQYYAYDSTENAIQSAENSYDLEYANIKIYSGTFTGENAFNTNNANACIYLRNQVNSVEGHVNFEMFGGEIRANVYVGTINNGGTRTSGENTINRSEDIMTELKFYGGTVTSTGNIFGQGIQNEYIGSSKIILSGNFLLDGNVYGGAKFTGQGDIAEKGTGNTNIYVVGASTVINGDIYGGSKSENENIVDNGLINGSTNIEITSGTINGDIYGGGYNAGVGVDTELSSEIADPGSTHITINGGQINKNIYGGSYNNYVAVSTNILLKKGTVGQNGNPNNYGIFGGNVQKQSNYSSIENYLPNTYITIGNDYSSNEVIYYKVYGGGKYDKITNSNIIINGVDNNKSKLSVFGGSNTKCEITNTNITLSSGTVTNIYGGGTIDDSKTEKSTITLTSGTVTNVFGAGLNSDVTETNINGNGSNVTNIFGGSEGSGDVTTSNIKFTNITRSNLTSIYGGSKYLGSDHGGEVSEANIIIDTKTTYTIKGVYGGSLGTEDTSGANVENANITVESGYINNVVGGGAYGDVDNVNLVVSDQKNTSNRLTITNLYGGSYSGGIVSDVNIDVKGGKITNLYGGGFVSNIGKDNDRGNIDINIYGGKNGSISNPGTSINNLYGGCYNRGGNGNAYADININIGKSAIENYDKSCKSKYIIITNIYGSGYKYIDLTNPSYSYDSVIAFGDININIDGSDGDYDNGENIIKDPYSKVDISGKIFGAGYYSTYDTENNTAKLNINNFGKKTIQNGMSNDCKKMISIERFNDVCIDNSVIQLTGMFDPCNVYTSKSYTFNRIKSLTLYNSSRLFLRRTVNLVEEYNSKVSKTDDILESVTQIENGGVKDITLNNVDNRIYTVDGINIIFAKTENVFRSLSETIDKEQESEDDNEPEQEEPSAMVDDNIYELDDIENWGKVNGMSFFGLYSYERNSASNAVYYDAYTPNCTVNQELTTNISQNLTSSYIESMHELNMDTNVDGFFTNRCSYYLNGNNVQCAKITAKEIIAPTPEQANYYDWIVGETTKTYEIDLVASRSSASSLNVQNIYLDYLFSPGATYTIEGANVLTLSEGVEFINKNEDWDNLSEEEANQKFALEISGTEGWLEGDSTQILINQAGITNVIGDSTYTSGNSVPTLRVKLYNSINISRTDDLGSVRLLVRGRTQTKNSDGENVSNTFLIVFIINLLTEERVAKNGYEVYFENYSENYLKFTSDSTIIMGYDFQDDEKDNLYGTTDNRILASSKTLPDKTKITLIDKVDKKIYYYQIDDSEIDTVRITDKYYDIDGNEIDVEEKDWYKYELSEFIEMGCFDGESKYSNNDINRYFTYENLVSSHEQYVVEYDFSECNITEDIKDMEIYMEMLNSSGDIKIGRAHDDNGAPMKVRFDLLTDSKAKIQNELLDVESGLAYVTPPSYTIVNADTISLGLNLKYFEQKDNNGSYITDTVNRNKSFGLSLEIIDDSGVRINAPKLVGTVLNVEYLAGDVPVSLPCAMDRNGVIRCKLSNNINYSNTYSLTLIINVGSIESGNYTAVMHFYTSNDGLFYGDNIIDEENTEKMNFKIVSKNIGFKVENENSNRILHKKNKKDLVESNNLHYKCILNDEIDENKVTVTLYKRNGTYKKIEDYVFKYNDITYTLVDFTDIFNNNIETLVDGEEYIVTTNLEKNDNSENVFEFDAILKDNVDTGEYKAVFKLYYGNYVIQESEKTFVIID